MNPTFENRLQKKWLKLRPWAEREGLTAWRVYDRDTPEVAVAVDLLGAYAHVSEFPNRKARRQGTEALRRDVTESIGRVLQIPAAQVHWKIHVPQMPGGEPNRTSRPTVTTEVLEGDLKFRVNLTDFLDTGLFLDHRQTRRRVRDEARGKRFLNLFGYTGSFSVHAAAGGASSTTTVDLSPVYLGWAKDNLALNQLGGAAHRQIRADVLSWLSEAAKGPERYELIVLDPPSFSRSKSMQRTFEVQRDHPALLQDTAALLAPKGTLYFSTNLSGFQLQLEAELSAELQAEELTPRSIPRDFEHKDVHRCWRLQRR